MRVGKAAPALRSRGSERLESVGDACALALDEVEARATPGPLRCRLRRAYASLMFALGRPAAVVMEQLGHTDARLTLRVYARAMRRGCNVSVRRRRRASPAPDLLPNRLSADAALAACESLIGRCHEVPGVARRAAAVRWCRRPGH